MSTSDQLVPAAFFSYVRADDDHENGYITELRRALAAEASAQLGEDFLIFQDRNDILWGQRWQRRIEESIDTATVLVAVLTPRFFKSDACKEEWDRFRRREEKLDRDDLILPIYFMQVPGWGTESANEWIVDAAARHYIDWRDLRFTPLERAEARKKIAELASRIVSVTNSESMPPSLASQSMSQPVDEVAFVELVAESEEAMPLFGQTIVDFGVELERIGTLAVEHTPRLKAADETAKPAAARLTVIRNLADAFDDPASRMEELAAEYVDQLARVDGGISALIENVREMSDPGELEAAREFAVSLRGLAEQGGDGLSSLEDFRKSVNVMSRLSSTIRPVLRRIDHAIEVILPSRDTFREWSEDLDAALASTEARLGTAN